MPGTRRVVWAASEFFDDLDHQLPPMRGPRGEPSAHDFLTSDLLRAVDTIADRYDELPGLDDGTDLRVLITTGIVVRRFAVLVRLDADDSVAMIGLTIDDLSDEPS